MARIRSIKPEFPQSESMGRISRDARLLFVQMWTLADDEGRLRGNSRMLASLLFPYDDDVPGLIGVWMEELEREGCIRCYRVDGQSYVEVANFLNHQKIDHPTKSKLPPFANSREDSRTFTVGRDRKGEDQGREKDIVGQEPDVDPPEPEIPESPPKRRTEAIEVLTFLNLKTGRDYQPVTANLGLIEARLKEGATVEDLRMVIARKWRDWKDDEKMRIYARPATLFNATKFAQYRGECVEA